MTTVLDKPIRLRPAGVVSARGVVGALVLILLLVLFLVPGLLERADPYALDVSSRFAPPSALHWFGTDEAGRDIFSRVVEGARISIGCSLIVVVAAAVIGTIVGAVGGWVGGWVDTVISKFTDVFLAFPYLVLAMAVSAAVGRDITSAVIALVVVWWPSYARMVRTVVRAQRQELSVKAARTLGASSFQTLRWHVVPHASEQLAVRMTLDVGYVLVSFTGLSFLGLGAQAPSPEWGLLIAQAQQYVLNAWWYAVFPGLVIVAFVSFTVWFGDGFEHRMVKRGMR